MPFMNLFRASPLPIFRVRGCDKAIILNSSTLVFLCSRLVPFGHYEPSDTDHNHRNHQQSNTSAITHFIRWAKLGLIDLRPLKNTHISTDYQHKHLWQARNTYNYSHQLCRGLALLNDQQLQSSISVLHLNTLSLTFVMPMAVPTLVVPLTALIRSRNPPE